MNPLEDPEFRARLCPVIASFLAHELPGLRHSGTTGSLIAEELLDRLEPVFSEHSKPRQFALIQLAKDDIIVIENKRAIGRAENPLEVIQIVASELDCDTEVEIVEHIGDAIYGLLSA